MPYYHPAKIVDFDTNTHGWNGSYTAISKLNFKQEIKIGVTGYQDFNNLPNSDLDLLIWDKSHHPWILPVLSKTSYNIPILGLTGIYNVQELGVQEQQDYVYYPHWFLLAKNYHDSWYSSGYLQNEKKHKFSCLNRNPKAERFWFYVQMHQKSFYQNTITSLFDISLEGTKINLRHFDFPDIKLDEPTIDYYTSHIEHLMPIGVSGYSHLGLDHPAFSSTYVNIISEHSYQQSFFSEKTVKPIAAEQLFLMAGPPGAIKMLESWGFDVFRDIIDHDYYDHESDWQQRLLKMLEVAEHLDRCNIEEIFSKTLARRQQNRQHLFSDNFVNTVLESLFKRIKYEFPGA